LQTLFQPSLYSLLFHGVVLCGIAIWPAMPDRSFDFAINRNVPAIELIASQLPNEAPAFEVLSIKDSTDREEREVAQIVESSSSAFLTNVEPPETNVHQMGIPLPLPTIPTPVATHSPSDEVLGIHSIQADLSNNEPPMYPAIAVQSRLEGTAILKLQVGVDGAVQEVTVIESSGHQVLDDAAINAVKKWKGKPAQRFGINVGSEEVLPIRFRL
jgi:periplasmic protein TonB